MQHLIALIAAAFFFASTSFAHGHLDAHFSSVPEVHQAEAAGDLLIRQHNGWAVDHVKHDQFIARQHN